MSTAAQIQANQLNAQASTGPKTDAGKVAVSQNAKKHGLTASAPVILTADEQTAFDAMHAAYQYELHPYTPTEQTLFKQLVLASWNIDRCHRLEAGIAEITGLDPLLDEGAATTLARIESYRTRAERLFHRNLKILKAIPSTKPVPQNKPKLEIETPQTPKAPIKLTPKIGRNDQCPCKSGKKYKVCCINNPNPVWPVGQLI